MLCLPKKCCSTSIQLRAKKLQLSSDTVTRRVQCMSNDQQEQLPHSINFVFYSIVLDTSKSFTDTEQIAVFIREVLADFKIYKEYLTLHSVYGSKKEKDFFCEFHATLQEAHI